MSGKTGITPGYNHLLHLCEVGQVGRKLSRVHLIVCGHQKGCLVALISIEAAMTDLILQVHCKPTLLATAAGLHFHRRHRLVKTLYPPPLLGWEEARFRLCRSGCVGSGEAGLDRLDRLEMCSRLEILCRLETFSRLKMLGRLEILCRLEMFSRLKMLGRLERLSVLCRSRHVSSEEARLDRFDMLERVCRRLNRSCRLYRLGRRGRVGSEESRLEMLCRSGLVELYRLRRLESSELVGRAEGRFWDAPFRRYISI
jgi:hypothetical protein